MFSIEYAGEDTWKLTGRFDAAQVEMAETALSTAKSSVVLDLTELDYIASAGISVVLILFKRLHGQGHRLKLVHPTPHVLNVFRYAGLDRVLDIVPD